MRILRIYTHALIIIVLFSLFISCTKDPPRPELDLSLLPYPTLSEYGFFVGDLKELSPTTGVLPYELNSPLFSNYAEKSRFIFLPEGTTANYQEKEVFDFPVGTVIIKTFYYDNDLRDPSLGRRIIETRLLIHKTDGWHPASYLWNDTQEEADFTILGHLKDVSWIHSDGSQRSTQYYVPNKNDCKGCHNLDKQLTPIGPKARHLNGDFTYPDGSIMNQLDKWKEMGYLGSTPALVDIHQAAIWNDPSTGDLNARARAYLDINCAHCHNPKGPAKNSALFLEFDREELYTIGVCKPPIAAGRGSGGHQFSIVPGSPETSIMYHRMNSTEVEVAMPELARSVVDEEGVALIGEWIQTMAGSCE